MNKTGDTATKASLIARGGTVVGDATDRTAIIVTLAEPIGEAADMDPTQVTGVIVFMPAAANEGFREVWTSGWAKAREGRAVYTRVI